MVVVGGVRRTPAEESLRYRFRVDWTREEEASLRGVRVEDVRYFCRLEETAVERVVEVGATLALLR